MLKILCFKKNAYICNTEKPIKDYSYEKFYDYLQELKQRKNVRRINKCE